jgi:deazaflavin-dependent oxidoreductase (nitroreductase family)
MNITNSTPGKNMMDLYPSAGWSRVMFKAPINFWRLGLGPLTGKIFLLITTTGRVSGLPRRTMVEYHKVDGVKYAACAFGGKADWYRNIQIDPRVTMQSSDGTESAIAYRVDDDEELLAVYQVFKRRDPPLTNWYLSSLGIEDTPEDVLENKDKVYWIGFTPTAEATPPGLDVDLAWLWLVGLLAVLGAWLSQKIFKD